MYQPLPPQPVPSFQNNNYGSPVPAPMTPLVPNNNNYVPNPPLNPSPLVPNLTPLVPNPSPLVPNVQPPPPMTSEMAQPADKYFQQSAPGWNDPPPLNKPLRQQVKIFYYF